MSTLTSLARAQAAATGTAQAACTVRHVHVSDRPLVFVPLTLAGEANAPLAAMIGDDPRAGRLLVVTQPRNRDQRFAFAAELADVVVRYVESYCWALQAVPGARGQEERTRFADAPQLLVPNPGCTGFVRLLGRSPGSAGFPGITQWPPRYLCSAAGCLSSLNGPNIRARASWSPQPTRSRCTGPPARARSRTGTWPPWSAGSTRRPASPERSRRPLERTR